MVLQEFYDGLVSLMLVSKCPDGKFPEILTRFYHCSGYNNANGQNTIFHTVHHLGDHFSRTFNITVTKDKKL